MKSDNLKRTWLIICLLIAGLSFIPQRSFSQCANIIAQGINIFPDGVCAPVQVQLQVWYRFLPIPAGVVQIRINWGDGSPVQTFATVQAPAGTYTTTANHPYPALSNCSYEPFAFPVVNGLACGAAVQRQRFSSWARDNENSGVLGINPVLYQVCYGHPVGPVVFNDVSAFNCRIEVEPDKPNQLDRWVQFIYGTNYTAGQGIPNLFINVSGTPVQLTNASGAPLNFSTRTHRYEGPIVQIPYPATGPTASTFTITAPAGADVGDYFEVTLRNWNVCNSFDPADTLSPAPITTTARILIIASPPIPTVANKTICFGGNRTLTVTSAVVGEIRWYSDAGLTTLVGTGVNFTQTATAAGTYTYYVVDADIAGNGCESPPRTVTLIINPIPNQPTITNAGSLSFCFDGVTSVVLTANPNTPPAISSYQWYQNAVAYSTSNPITLNQVAHSGNYTVQTYGVAPTNCPSPLSNPVTVTIGNPAIVNAGPPTATICSNAVYNTAGSYGGGASSVTWSTSGNGTFGSTTNPVTTYTPGSADITAGTVTLTLTTDNPAGPCNAVSDFITLTVVRAPSAYAGADAATCQGSPYTVNDATASNYNTLNWTETGAGSITAGQGTLTPTYTPAAGDFGGSVTLTLTATGNAPCANTSDAKVLYVDRTPTATVGPAQLLCNSSTANLAGNASGNDLLNGAYGEWTFMNNLIWQETFSESPDYSTSGAQWTTSGITPDADTYFAPVNRLMTGRDLDAEAVWQSGLINISSAPSVKISVYLQESGSLEFDDYINVYYRLNGGAETPFTTNGTNADDFGIRTATVTGLSGNNIRIVIRCQNSAADEYYYFDNIEVRQVPAVVEPVITTRTSATSSVTGLWDGINRFRWSVFSNHNGCDSVSALYTINVNPLFSLAQLHDNASICVNTSTNINVILTGGTSPYTINYTANGVAQAPRINYVSGTNFSTGNLAVNTTYVLTSVTDANGCPALSFGTSILITVGSLPTGATLTGSGDACAGASSFILSVITGGAPPYTVNYTRNAIAQPPATPYTSGNNIPQGVLAVGAHIFVITSVQDVCGGLVPPGGLPVPYTININPIPSAAATTNNTPAICSNGTTDIVLQSTVPSSDFIWTVSNAPAVTWTGGKAPVGGTRVNGIGTSIAQNLQHTATFPTTVTYTITPRGPGATACLGPSITRDVIVNPTAQVNDPANQVVCNGNPTTAVNFGTVNTGGTTTYSWTNNNTPIGLAASGTGNIPSFTATNGATNPIAGTITVTPTYTNGGVSCTGPVQTFTITVNPSAQVNDPADQVVCNGSPTTAVTFGTNRTGGTTTYDWTNNNISINLAASGTGNIASFTATNAGTSPVTATITVTPTFTNGGASCPGTAQTFTITVNPSAQVNDPADQVVCNNNTTTAVTFGTNRTGGATTYAWTNDNTSINLAASGTGNIASFTATNAGTAPVTATITVTPTFTNGGASCPGTAQTFTITVNPSAQVNDPADQVVCNNSSTTAVTFGTNRTGGATTYAWTNNTISIGLAANGTGNIASFTATNAGTSPVTATITVTPTFTNGGASCPGTAQTFTITVNPSAQVNDPADQVVCNNSPTTAVTFGTNRTGGTTTYAWSNNNTSINLAASGTGNIASFTATNAGTAAITATITVTPTFTNGGVGCPGTAQTFTITVNPTPTLNSSLTPPDICSNTAFSYTPTSATAGTTFNWTRNVVGGITPVGPTSGVNNINETLRNFTSTTIAVTYTYTLTANSCPNTQNVVVNIKPEPVITSGQNPDVCSNVALNYRILLDNFTNPGANVTFTWPLPAIDPNISGGNARPAPSNANITDVFTNVSGSLGTATYTVSPSYNGCAGNNQTVVIDVGAQPILADLNDEACSNVATGLILGVAAGSVPAANYDITAVSVNPSLNIISQPAIPQTGVANTYLQNATYRNLTGGDLTVVYTVVPVFSPGCVGNAKNITITIHPEPIILLGQTKTICNNEPANMEIRLNPPNIPAGSEFRWAKPTMNDASNQGTAQSNVAADPAGTIHITDAFINAPTALPYTPITATYYVTPTSSFGCDGDQIPVIITINPKPNTSSISGPLEACTSTTNMIYSVTATGGSRYYWYLPPSLGTITFGGTINDAFFVMNAAGSAAADSISVIERNSYTCWGDTVKLGVEIFPYPPVAAVAGDNSVCAGEAGQIYSVPNNPGSVYNWSVPIGSTITSFPVTQNQITVTFGSMNGNISVVETSVAGCVTNHTPLNVTVNPLPSPSISPSKALICLGEAVTFTAGPAGAANYNFFVNGVSAQNGAANTYITNSLVNGQGVTVEVTLASGCFATSTASYVIVSDPPVVTMVSSDADNRICTGTSVTFTASSVTATSFEFRVNGIAQQSGASKTYVTSTLTNGNIVSIIGTTAFGCSAPGNNITIQVDPLPVANFAGTATICIGSTTNLAVNFTTGTAPYQIQINQGVGTISPYNSGAAIPVAPVVTTTYTLLSITDANGCSVTSPSANITGQPIVTILNNIAISIQPLPVTNCPGASVSFSVLATGSSPAYQWRRNGTNLANDGRITGVLTADLNIANISAADAGNYDVVVSGACLPATSNAVALTVLENIQITGHPANVVECPGETVQFGVAATGTNPTYRWRKNGSPLSDGGSISGSDTDTLTISNINSFTAGTYDVVVSGTCAPATSNSATLTINVQPQITVEPTSKIICEGGSTSFTVNTGSTTGPIYNWQVDDGGGFDTITAGPYAGFNTNTLTVNPAASSINGYRYRVLVSGACNPPVTSVEATLTVRENPEIITPPADSTVCENSSVAFTVDPGVTTTPSYAWEVYNGTVWSTITGAPYSGYNTSTLGLFNATSAFNNYRYRVTVSGACNPPVLSAEATLTVREKPEVTVHPTAAIACEDGSVIFTVNAGVTTAPAYQWQIDAGAGFTDVSGVIYSGINTNTLTVNPITSPMNGYRYRAVISGTCTPDAISNPALLTIREKPEITLQPTSQTVCETDNTQFIVNPGVTTNPTFLWQYNTGSGWNPVPADAQHSGVTTNTLSITGALPTMTTWQYRVVISGSCAPPVTSNAVTLTVNQRPEIIVQPIDAAICEDANTSFTVNAGVTTNPTYQWQVSTGGPFGNISGGLYTGENTATLNITGTPSTMNGYRYRVIVGGYCTPAVTSNAVTLTVYQKPEVTAQPVDRTICEGDNTSFVISAGVTTNPAYQWEVNQGSGFNAVIPGPEYSGINSNTLNIIGGTSAMNNYQYRAIISGTCAPSANSNAAILTVREKPEIITQPQNSAICEGSPTTFTVDAGVTTGASYQWQVDPNTGTFVNVAGALYSGQTTNTLNIFNVPSTYNGYLYRVIVSGACTPAITSNNAALTVRERPEITAQPANAVICEDGTTQFIVNAGVTTTPVYTWEVNDGGGFDVITGGSYLGFTTNTLTVNPAVTSMNNYSYRVTISGACTPDVTSNIVFLTVDEKPEIIADPQDTTVCEGTGTVFSVNTGVTTNPTYLWQVNDGGGWVTATGGVYINQTTANLGLTTTNSTINNYRYRVIVSGKCAPAVTSGEAVLTIREKPEVTVPPTNVTECEDGTVNFTVNAGVTTNPTYQWQVDQGFGFFNLSGGVYSGETTNSLTATGITSVMNNYKYRAVVSGTCAPSVNSAAATLTVNEKPEVTWQPVDKTICEDGNTFFRVSPGVTTLPTFVWEYNTGSGWNAVPADAWHSGLTNDTLLITGAISTMNGWQYRAVISGTCIPVATSNAAILTINEKPEITIQPVDSAICENANAAFIVNAGVTTSATYQWQVDPNTGTFSNVSGGYYAGGTTPVLNVVNAISTMNGYRYRVIIGGTCTPTTTSNTVTLTVYQRPEVTAHPVAKIICEGDNTSFVVNAGVTTNPAYQWEVDQGSGFNAVIPGPEYSGINSNTLNIIGGTTAMNNYQYRAVISGTCAPDATSNPAILTVRERPEIITQPVDSTICEGSSASFTVDAGVTTGATYQWQVDPNTGTFVNVSGAGYSGQTTSMLNIFNAPSTWNGYRYRVVISGSCTPAITSNIVILTVYQRPEIIGQPANAVICEDGSTLFTVNPGVTTNPAFIWEVNDGGGFDTITGGPYLGFTTNTLTVNPAITSMNSYSYRVTISGTCTPEVTSNTVSLTVDEKPEIIADPQDTTVCEGTGTVFSVNTGVTTNPTYLWQFNDGGGWVTATGGVYINQTTANLGLTTTNSTMNNYRYRVIVSGKCTPSVTSGEAVLTIREKPEVTVPPANVTECEDGTVNFTVNAGVTTNPTYQWQVDQGFGFFNVSGGVYSGETANSLTATGITSVMNNYRYRAVVGGTCAPSVNSASATLTVNEKPEVAWQPVDRTICEDGNTFFRVNPGVTTAPTFVWEYSSDNGSTWNPVPVDAVHSGLTNDTLLITGAVSAMNGWQYRAVISGTCAPSATSNAAILTIDEKPEIAIQPVDSAICENSNAAFIVDAGVTSSPTYQWQVDPNTGTFSNVSGGYYAGGTTPVLNVVNAISTMNGYRYRVIVGGTCTPNVTSVIATLTVYQRPEVTAHPVAKTICEGDNTFFAVNAGVTTNPAYQWEVDMGVGFNPVVAGPEYSGINSDTLFIIGGTSAMNNWQYRAVISGTCAPDANSNPAVLTIRERPEIISQPVDSTICEGGSASFTVDAGVTTSPSYQWQVDKNTGSFVNVSGAGYSGQTTSMLNIFNAPSTWNGYRFRVVISGSCTPATTSDTVILTVLQRPEITVQPTNAVVCEDGSTLFTVNPGVTTNPSFIWLVDEGSGYDTITGGVYTGYNTATLNVTTTSSLMNGYLYKVTVSGVCTPEVTSSEVLLTIDEKPEVIVDPIDTTVCEGTGAAFFIDAGVTTNPVYKWQVNTGAGWADVSGVPYMGQSSSSLTLTSTTSAMNNWRYRAIVSGKCAPADTSAEAVLNIYEKPEVTIHPVDRTECEGGSVIYFVNPGVTTNPTFQWQVDKGSGFFDITDLNYSGINNDTLTVLNITSGMHGYRYRVIVSGTCAPADAISNPARLYINEKPEVTQHPANMTVCENDNAYFRVNPGVTTAPAFQWAYSTNNGVTWNAVPAALPYSGVTNDTLYISGVTSAMNNYQYRAVVGGTCAPTATSNAAVLTVNIRPVITMPPSNSIICENDNTTFTVNAGTTTNPAYQWQVDQGSGFNNAFGTVYSGATTTTLTLTNVPSYMTGYRYQVIVSGACTPSVTSNIVTLTVYEKPEVMTQPAAVTVCEDDNALFTVNPGVTTSPTYQWQVDQGGGFVGVPLAPPYTGAANDSLMITGVTAAMNNYRYRVVINGTCTPAATSNSALLTVREKPEITANPISQTICEDGNTSFTVNAGVTTNPTYQWQMDPNTGTFINVSGGFYSGQNSATLTITGALSAMNGYRYQVIVSGYCNPPVTSGIAVLNINEKPEIKRQPFNQTVCEDDETYFATDAGVTTNPTYQWQVDQGSGFIAIAAGPYSGANTDSLIITTVSSAMHTYMYRVIVSGTCVPPYTSNPALLFVNEKPEVIVPPADTVVCENNNAAFFVDAGVTSSPTYRWQVNTGTGFNNISDGGKYIGSTTSKLSIFNATSNMNGYIYRVVISGTCTPQVNSPQATLTVNTKPAITVHPNDATICEGANTSFSVTATGSALTYQWQADKNDGNGYTTIANGGVYSGATTATLQITGANRTYNNYNYKVIVNGTCAPPMPSNIARLLVNTPPEILTQPANSTICEFNNTSFFVIATGGNISYQWQENNGTTGWQNLSSSGNYIGTTSANLNIFNISRSMNGYRYRVLISGICSPAATSAVVTLTVNTKPEILVQPDDTTVCETLPVQFSVSIQGTNLAYTWQEDGGGGFTDIINGGKYSGANTATLRITNPTPLMTGYRYRVMVAGTCPPSVISNFAILTVNTFPAIFTQPEDKEICENGVTAFISNATGTGVSYHWQENSGAGFADITDGGVYNGANTTTLTLSNVPVSMNGNSYRLQVVGACAPISSNEVDLIVNANPTAGITGDGMYPMVCGGLDLNLDGSPAGGTGTYTNHSWTGDVFPLTVINTRTTVFNTVAPGSFNLTYTVTDSKGCKASDVTVITNERPQVQFISDAKPSCGLLTVNFTNQSTGAVSYEWDFDDPSSPGVVTDVNPSHDFTNFTPQIYYYNVSLVGLSPNGCGDTMRQVVTLYPSIDATFTINPVDGCNPIIARLDAIPGGSTYFWNFDDGNAEYGGAAATHQFINTTGDAVTYTVELTTTSFYGCTDTKTADITIYPLPIVNFSADPVMQKYPSSTVTFTNLTPTGSWTYTWQYGDGNTSTDISPVYSYAVPGEYNVTLTALTAECIDSISHKITITPAAPIADFSPPETGCAPLVITFDNQSEYATGYLWDFGNGSQSTKESPTFTYYEAGIYAVKLIVYGPGGTDNLTRLVEVKQTPTAYSNVAPTYVFVNDVPIKCFNLSTDTVRPVYLWNFGDHNTSDEFEPTHVYLEPGRYDVILTVTNDNDCADEYVFSYIEVEPAGQVIFPNVFKPNPNGPSGGEYRPGEDNNEIFFPGVYDQVAEYELVIYNRWGEQIFISEDVNIGWDGYLNDKLAEQGVYIWKVKVKYANGKVENMAGDITLLR